MYTDDDCDISLLEPRERPKVDELLVTLRSAVNVNANELLSRMRDAKDIRDAYWTGKTRDAKKWKDEKNRNLGPFPGSSDVSIRLADQVIWEKSLILLLSTLRSKLTATPAELDDTGKAATAVALLRHFLAGSMELEVWIETGRLFDSMLCYGHGIVRVDWKVSHRLVQKSLTYAALLDWAKETGQQQAMEQLAQLAEQAPEQEVAPEQEQAMQQAVEQAGEQAAAMTVQLLSTPEDKPQLKQLLLEYDPSVCPKEVTRLAGRLQGNKRLDEHDYYAKEITESRPCWTCLQPWVDVFYIGLGKSLQDEPFIGETEWVTGFQLRERAAIEGWDQKWVEAVLEHPGPAFATGLRTGYDWVLSNANVNWTLLQTERNTRWHQLIRICYKASTDDGVTAVWETMIHECVPDLYAYHKLRPEADGEYPYVAFPRQSARRLCDCTGIPEEVEPEQSQLKALADSRMDMTSLLVRPPMGVHWKDIEEEHWDGIRPGGTVPLRDGMKLDFIKTSDGSAQTASLNDELQIRKEVSRRFGLMDKEVPESLTQMHMAVDVGHMQKHMNVVLKKTFALLQQNMDPMEGVRVAGGPEVFAAGEVDSLLSASRDEIRGTYDFHLEFDPNDLNLEWVAARVKAITELVTAIDHTALTDRGTLLKAAIGALSPKLASVVKSEGEAAVKETEDEQRVWSVIAAGEEPPMPTEGVDFQSRLAMWERMLQRSTTARGKIMQDPLVQQLAQSRLKYLQQGVQQQKNALTGKRGTETGFDAMEEQQGKNGGGMPAGPPPNGAPAGNGAAY